MFTRLRAGVIPAMAATALLWTVTAGAAPPQTPTLGEIAKKEEERRKKLPAPSKVFTNKDLPKTTSQPAPPPAAAEKKPETQKPADTQKPAEEVKDEAWWRQRITVVRSELQRAELALDAFQSRVNALTNDFAARDDPYQRAQISIDRQKALNELERVRSDIARLKQQIADIEEEARVAGVPPGWLR